MTSKHADLLNALDKMQHSVAYAIRRPVLAQAERLIASQERSLDEVREYVELWLSSGCCDADAALAEIATILGLDVPDCTKRGV